MHSTRGSLCHYSTLHCDGAAHAQGSPNPLPRAALTHNTGSKGYQVIASGNAPIDALLVPHLELP